jgi:hypothetical protein
LARGEDDKNYYYIDEKYSRIDEEIQEEIVGVRMWMDTRQYCSK